MGRDRAHRPREAPRLEDEQALGPFQPSGQPAERHRRQAHLRPLPVDHRQEAQHLALSLGANWAGASEDIPPAELDAAIIYAPVGPLVPLALRALRKGGRVVCAGIHMSDIPAFPYHILWGERQIISVANLTRRDGIDFLAAAANANIRTHSTVFTLDQANEALAQLREGKIVGTPPTRYMALVRATLQTKLFTLVSFFGALHQ